jgi:ribosomal protein L14
MMRSKISLDSPQGVDFKNVGNEKGKLCAWLETGKCGVATRFSDGTSVKLQIRIPKEIGGWFLGRIGNPEMSIQPVSSRVNRLTVSAEPVEVPITKIKWPLFDPEFQEYTNFWKKQYDPNGKLLEVFRKNDDARIGGGDGIGWSYSSGIEMFKAYEGLMGDRSLGSTRIWSFSSLSLSSSDGFGSEVSVGYDNPCFADKTRVQGILTTNSMVYQPGLPSFSKGQLSYQVGGLHYNHDGSVFNGEYTLQMRADDARCLYGYSEAPIQTKVSVTDSGGTQKIATTSVSERGGWLTIRARNFTFSSPKIVVSIKQGKKSKAASTASVSVGKGKSLTAKTLMTKAKIKAKKGDKLDVSVVGAKTTGVTDSGKTLKFKSNGTYFAKVSVTRKNGTSTSRVFKVVVK